MTKRKEKIAVVPVHPGTVLKDGLTDGGLSQAKFAAHIGITPAYLSDIINGRRGISAVMAHKIGRALGTGPEVWSNMQSKFDLYSADEKEFANIEKIAT